MGKYFSKASLIGLNDCSFGVLHSGGEFFNYASDNSGKTRLCSDFRLSQHLKSLPELVYVALKPIAVTDESDVKLTYM